MKSTQDLIEKELLRLCVQGNFEAFMLFNDEGLPMAGVEQSTHYSKDVIAALSVALQQPVELLEDFHVDVTVHETSIRTTDKFRIVSRPFQVEGSRLILMAIVPQNGSYRKITNEAIRKIQELMSI